MRKEGEPMHTALIKETIQLDKEAREAVNALQKEKETLEERVKQDELALIKTNKKKLTDLIESTKQNYEAEIVSKTEKEKEKFIEMLDVIKKEFDEKENEWIDAIYAYCVE
ncbi:TRAP-type C4-dicarboxylate transport system substrate-binding protein [Acholeplasma morum]|uniref:hypothetical protein n=1 Tax=Paracholeplasma morum TaxID=264637 RepID=UPI001958A282|nr:hypothetical protein [Paracholeplasma morum]MBM7453538.1 TRAP-type C4-dicarboxylate transport system substrate-binding protein [Paracholeplasma morum]